MATVTVDGVDLEMTPEEEAAYRELVDAGIRPWTAAQMTLGGYEDVVTEDDRG